MNKRDYNKQFQKKTGKKKFIILSILVVIAIAVTSVFFAQDSGENQGYRTISVVETSGNVSVVKEGIEYSAYPGMLLQEGHEIVTAGNSYVRLVLDEDKYVKLESGSKLLFETLGMFGSGKTRLNLERGSLISELVNPLEADEEYVVNTPNAVLAVRGTFFRVDLGVSETGEVKADVMTYGGQVASQRVLPTGETLEEEVLIDAGFKASISMTTENTHYVVETEEGELVIVEPTVQETPDGEDGATIVLPTKPITTDDIPDEDLVDVYFAAENGHELFVTAEEVKTDLEVREIAVEEYKPVYEKAEEVKKEQEAAANPTAGTSNTTSATIIANDSQPLAKVEEDKKEDTSTNTNGNTTTGATSSNGLVDGVHVHSKKTTTIAPTCTTAGSEVVTCRSCKETISTKEISALGHTYGEWSVTKAPSCTANGSQEHSCSVCGHKENQSIAVIGHSYASEFTVDKAATCTTDGSKSKHCSLCDSTSEVTVIPAAGHTKTAGATADVHSKCFVCGDILSVEHEMTQTGYVAPSCTDTGSETYTCDCGYTYTNEVAALGHNFSSDFTIDVAATCTTDGSKSKHCSQCSETSEVTVIPATGHTEVVGGTADAHSKCSTCDEVLSTTHIYTDSETKLATCEETGTMTHSCDCGYEYTSEIPALGHDYAEEFTVDVEATCTTDGSKSKHCSQCSETTEVTVIPATGHTETAGATADVHSYCSVCNAVLSTTHIYTDTETTAATCEETGVMTHSCECGYEYTSEISALGHDYAEEFTVDVEATCTTDGSKSKHCSQCSETTEVTVIPATGHTEVVGGTADAHSYCSVCNEVLSTTHTYADTETKAATCEEAGVMTHTCGCGYEYTSEISALGHDYAEEFTVDVEATCTTDGSKSKHCSRCDSTSEETEIAATGHDYVQMTDEPTETQNGRTYEKCSVCGDEINEFLIVALNSVNFPDANLLALVETYNTDGESGLTIAEIEEITSLETEEDVVLTSLEGIEYLTSLEVLNVLDASGISEVDVSKNTALNTLALPNAAITSIDVSNNSALTMLLLSGADITELDVTSNIALQYLYLENASVTGLDVRGLTNLQYLVVNGASIQTLDVTGCTAMMSLQVSDTALTSLDVSTLTSLYELAAENTEISVLDVKDCTGLTQLILNGSSVQSIDISANTAVNKLSVDNCTSLTEINAGVESGTHALQYLEVEGCSALTALNISNTATTSLDLAQMPALQTLSAKGYAGTELTLSEGANLICVDLSNATALAILDASSCEKLSQLILTECNALTTVNLSGTAITGFAQSAQEGYLVVPNTATVTDLNLSNTNINYTNASSDKFTWMGAVRTLNLSNAGITDAYWTQLATYLPTTLTTLDLSDNTELTTLDVSKFVNLTEDGLNVEGCTGLTDLNISNTQLSSVDISTNTALTTLIVSGSGLESIAMSNKTSLTTLTAQNVESLQSVAVDGCTALANLDLSESSNITYLNVAGIAATSLDISHLSALETLYMHNAKVTTLSGDASTLDFSNNPSLKVLGLNKMSSFTAIDLSNNAALEQLIFNVPGFSELNFPEGSAMKELQLVNADSLLSLDMTNCSQLTNLQVTSSDKLQSVDTSGCSELETVTLSGSTVLTSLDLSGCTALTSFDIGSCTALQSLDLNGCTGLSTLDMSSYTNLTALTSMDIGNNANLTSIDFSTLTALATLNVANSGSMTEVNISNTKLKTFDSSGMSQLVTYVCSNATNLTEVVVSNASGLVTLDVSGCTSLEALNLASRSKLATLDVSNCAGLKTLNVSSCTALTSVDISTLANLEVFNADNAGITTLSGSDTCLDFTNNTKLTEIRLGNLKTFSEIDLTQNSSLEVFVYNYMPMETIDLSNCTALKNFQVAGCGNLTSLDFSNCPNINLIKAENSSKLTSLNTSGCTNLTTVYIAGCTTLPSLDLSNCTSLISISGNNLYALTELNVSGCTLLSSVSFAGTNNISTADLTNAGSALEEGTMLVFTVSNGSTTQSKLSAATGWDATKMSITY